MKIVLVSRFVNARAYCKCQYIKSLIQKREKRREKRAREGEHSNENTYSIHPSRSKAALSTSTKTTKKPLFTTILIHEWTTRTMKASPDRQSKEIINKKTILKTTKESRPKKKTKEPPKAIHERKQRSRQQSITHLNQARNPNRTPTSPENGKMEQVERARYLIDQITPLNQVKNRHK